MIKALHNAKVLAPWLDRATTGRADAILIGDSNVIFASDAGLRFAFQRALENLFGVYATGVLAPNAYGGWATGSWGHGEGGPNGGDAYNVAQPAWLEQYRLAPPGAPGWFNGDWWGMTAGQSTPDNAPTTIAQVLTDAVTNYDGSLGWALNKDNALRWHINYATFATGTGGAFRPTCRRSLTLNSVGSTTPTIVTTTGVNALAYTYVDMLPTTPQSDARRTGNTIECQVAMHFSGAPATGPACILGTRFEDPDKARGVSYNAFMYQGGQDTRQAALSLQGATTLALGQYFDQATRLQNVPKADRVLLVHVIQGQNDTGDVALSVGPSPAASNTPGGCADNHEAVYLALRAAWTAAGFDAANLFFWWGPYHPQGVSRKAWGGQVDDALRRTADRLENVAVSPRDEVVTSTALFTANAWWDSDTPDAHLKNRAAYGGWADHVIDACEPRPRVIADAAHAVTAAYYRLYDAAGRVWDDVAKGWTRYASANYARYAVALAQEGASGRWVGTLPAELRTAGKYRAVACSRAGGAAAESDTVIATVDVDYDGLRDRNAVELAENTVKVGDVQDGFYMPVDVVRVNGGPATLDTGGGAGGTGDGDFAINHDGGEGVLVDDVPATPGCMSMEYNGQGIDNGRIIAFLKSDYDAGRRGQNQRQGVTWTNGDGDWVSDLMLDGGKTYTIQASAGRFFTRTFKVEIP
jgi:hypothetical protein